MIAGALPVAGTRVFAEFSGYFRGYYAPVQWTAFVRGNPMHQTTAFVASGTARQSVEPSRAAPSASQGAPSQLSIGSSCLLKQPVAH